MVSISMLVAVGSFLLGLAAYSRAAHNYVEDQRDKLLAQITDLSIEAWKRDSELVALLHVHAGATSEIQRASQDLVATAQLLRDGLREQIGALDSRFNAVVEARGFEVRNRLKAERIALFRHLPLLAAQSQDITSHVRMSTERLRPSGQQEGSVIQG